MTTVQDETKALFRKAAERASLAPSIHNTQPWRFVFRPDALELQVDPDRQLRALDPTGRQLVISCGCALFNARVGLAADRVVQVDRLPDPANRDLLARLTVLDESAPWTPLVRLDPVIERRHTNRRDFFDQDVPPDVIYELTTAAEQEGASLLQIVKPEHKMVAAQLSQEAEAIQNADPRYRAELETWTTTDLHRSDGVPVYAIPHTDERSEPMALVRNFDVAGKGWMPGLQQSSLNHCLMVLGMAESNRPAWLRGGEALQRILLEATRLDYVVSLASQVVEVGSTRDRLRKELDLEFHPLLLMRIGRAAPTPASKRRDLNMIILETEGDLAAANAGIVVAAGSSHFTGPTRDAAAPIEEC
jgi:nitroreductase